MQNRLFNIELTETLSFDAAQQKIKNCFDALFNSLNNYLKHRSEGYVEACCDQSKGLTNKIFEYLDKLNSKSKLENQAKLIKEATLILHRKLQLLDQSKLFPSQMVLVTESKTVTSTTGSTSTTFQSTLFTPELMQQIEGVLAKPFAAEENFPEEFKTAVGGRLVFLEKSLNEKHNQYMKEIFPILNIWIKQLSDKTEEISKNLLEQKPTARAEI